MKYKRILVGSISDWYTSTIVKDLEDLGYTVTRFSVDDNRINKVLDTILKMIESVLLKVGLRVNLSRNTLNYVEGNLSNVNSKALKNILIHASWIR